MVGAPPAGVPGSNESGLGADVTLLGDPPAPETRRLRLACCTDTLSVDGWATGTRYVFSRDRTTEVAAADAPHLLGLTRVMGGCCGPGSVGAATVNLLTEE